MDEGTFRTKLLDAKILVDMGSAGLYARSGTFEGVVTAIESAVTRIAGDEPDSVLRFPALMGRSIFEKTDYLRSFPDMAGAISTYAGGDKEHRKLLARLDGEGDWEAELTPADVVLTSSACHPIYNSYTGTLPDGGTVVDLLAWCFRHEPSLDPGRMQCFRQREMVFMGTADAALAHRDLWVDRALDFTHSIGLDTEAEVANDPFFGRAGRILANGQLESALKMEIVTHVGSDARTTAVASSNCHTDHFGHNFDIRSADGAVAHSACVGFGLERMTLALFRQHGFDPQSWPAEVRAVLWP
jgi:seryl-tRNA synthetase